MTPILPIILNPGAPRKSLRPASEKALRSPHDAVPQRRPLRSLLERVAAPFSLLRVALSSMKLTRHEIILVVAIASALVIGEFVKRYRAAHPVEITPAKPLSKNISRAKSVR